MGNEMMKRWSKNNNYKKQLNNDMEKMNITKHEINEKDSWSCSRHTSQSPDKTCTGKAIEIG